MLDPNYVVYLTDGATVGTLGPNELTNISRISCDRINETDEIRDGELVEQKILHGQTGSWTVDADDIDHVDDV